MLRRATGARREEHDADVARAADALEAIMEHGFEEAQRRVNPR